MNEDLHALWEEHLSGLQDSSEHIRYLASSDRCFLEWVEENYPERIDEVR